MADQWIMVQEIDDWLDGGCSEAYHAEPLAQDWARISKVSEELGEAIQAFIGYTGQNPRKGFTHELDSVLDELADVVLTGVLAIQHFTKDASRTAALVASKISKLHTRIPH